MSDIGTIALILIIANLVISYKGFTNFTFFERYKFNVDDVLLRKEYIQLVSSGFLHVNWPHFMFNMFSLYVFSGPLEYRLGELPFLFIYLISLLGGNLFALFIHRNHGDYSAVGASGAVCGIIFAGIALFPGMEIGFILLPFSFPSWIYGALFVGYSIYGIRSGKDNIGHEAHLGGALIGMLTALFFQPNAWFQNYGVILLILVPTIIFIYFLIYKPHVLWIDVPFFQTKKKSLSIDQKYNTNRANKQKELDALLDKVGKKGYEGLSKKEKQKLNDHFK